MATIHMLLQMLCIIIIILFKKIKIKFRLPKIKGRHLNPTLVEPYLNLQSFLVKRPFQWVVAMQSTKVLPLCRTCPYFHKVDILILGPLVRLLQVEFHLIRLFLFNITNKDITHKQIQQTHTKTRLPNFFLFLSFTRLKKKNIIESTDFPPNYKRGRVYLLGTYFVKTFTSFFSF